MRPWHALPLMLVGAEAALPAAAAGEPPARETNAVVYGDDPCPVARDPEEIVVCARRPEEERYRIPEALRRGEQLREQSWGTRTEALEEAQVETRPDGCSVVGSFGQTGCRQQMLRQWRAERRARRR